MIRQGPRCQGVKRPSPNFQGVTRPGRKCQEAKRPVQKSHGAKRPKLSSAKTIPEPSLHDCETSSMIVTLHVTSL